MFLHADYIWFIIECSCLLMQERLCVDSVPSSDVLSMGMQKSIVAWLMLFPL